MKTFRNIFVVLFVLFPALCFGWGEVTRPQLLSDTAGYGVDMVANAHRQYDTIADLRAGYPADSGKSVYLVERDGGFFTWDTGNNAANITADIYSGVFVAPDTDLTGASGAWVRQINDAVLVEWFGITGDGVTDDSGKIQAAINVAGYLNKAKVILPEKNMGIAAAIVIAGSSTLNMTLSGISWDSILTVTGATYGIELGDNVNTSQFITIKDLTVAGNATALGGIVNRYAARGFIEHVSVKGFSNALGGILGAGAAGLEYYNTWILTVENSNISQNYYGVNAVTGSGGVNALNIDHCIIESNLKYGVFITGVGGTTITNTTIEDGAEVGIYIATGRSIKIDGCYFEALSVSGIYIGNSAYTQGVNITDNIFGMNSSTYDIDVNGVIGLNITGNVFARDRLTGMIHLTGGLLTQDVFISGNSKADTVTSYLFLKLDSDLRRGYIVDFQNREIIVGDDETFVLPYVTVTAPTLLNSWANVGGGYTLTGYYETVNNIVKLQGRVSGGAVSSSLPLFTLPAGSRPALRSIFSVMTNDGSNNVVGRIDVASNGDVLLMSGGTTSVSFEGVSFLVAP